MPYYYGTGYYSSYILLLPAILLTFYAQAKISAAYRKYSGVANSKGITGAQAADIILRRNGLAGIPIQMVSGNLTDNYNPASKVLNLSEGVYQGSSIASIAIAAHECGHALQHAQGYSLLKFRNTIVPAVNISSNLAWPLLIFGIMVGSATGDLLFNIGLVLFLMVVVFHLVTLPVELDASKRAINMLEEYGIVGTDSSEIGGAKSVLNAAALTYIAGLAVAIANFLRILSMRGRRR